MKFHLFIFSAILLRSYPATVILQYRGAESKFVEAKTGYDLATDPFDKLSIEVRSKICDAVLNAGVYVFVRSPEDVWDSMEMKAVTAAENYQTLVMKRGNHPKNNGDTSYTAGGSAGVNAITESPMNEVTTITINEKVLQFKMFPCTISKKFQWYLSYGIKQDMHFLLQRTAFKEINNASNAPLVVVGMVDLTSRSINWENVEAKFEDSLREIEKTPALEKQFLVSALKPYEKFQLCSVAEEIMSRQSEADIAKITEKMNSLIDISTAALDSASTWTESNMEKDASTAGNLKKNIAPTDDDKSIPPGWKAWDDDKTECKKREVSLQNMANGFYLVDTLACTFNDTPVASSELFVAVGKIKNNVMPVFLLTPDEGKETRLKVTASVDIESGFI